MPRMETLTELPHHHSPTGSPQPHPSPQNGVGRNMRITHTRSSLHQHQAFCQTDRGADRLTKAQRHVAQGTPLGRPGTQSRRAALTPGRGRVSRAGLWGTREEGKKQGPSSNKGPKV